MSILSECSGISTALDRAVLRDKYRENNGERGEERQGAIRYPTLPSFSKWQIIPYQSQA